MDRIKYRRMLAVYLSDLRALEERGPNIWQFFLDGQFSVQTNYIPRTAKSVGHAGEQENKKTKGSRWFCRYHKTRKPQEQIFSNIACGFRGRERTKINLSFAKERNKNSRCIESK